MTTREIVINRDAENDVLYVIKNTADKSKTINMEWTSDIMIRLDDKTKQVVGLTIEDFSIILPHFAKLEEYELMEKFDSIIDFLNAPDMIPA